MSAPIPAPPPDASLTLRGLINTASQSFAGTKTFRDGLIFDSPTFVGDSSRHQIGIGNDPGTTLPPLGTKLYLQTPGIVTGMNQNMGPLGMDSESTALSGNFYGAYLYAQANPASDSSASVRASYSNAATKLGATQNFTGSFYGVQGQVNHTGTGTLNLASGLWGLSVTSNGATGVVTTAVGVKGRVDNSASGSTITNAFALFAQNPAASLGTNVNRVGLVVEEQTGATHNTDVLIGTTTVPTTGDYALYSASTRTSAIAGPLQYQDGTAQPTAGGLGILQFGVTSCVDTQFLPPGLGAALASAVTVPVPFTGTCRAMYVVANTTGAANYKFTIVKNGADFNNAALGVGGAGTSVLGAPSLFTVTAGDKIAVRMNNLGGVGNPVNVTVTLSFGVGT